MWILIIMVSPFVKGGYGITSIEMSTKEACVSASKFSKSRDRVFDAWCVKK